jgi:chromosome segregation ATPase
MDAIKQNTHTFQTPTRILIPKLLKSRDGWKLKANQRKRLLKSAKVRIRDLEASRNLWRERAEAAEQKVRESHSQATKAEQARADLQTENEQLRDHLKETALDFPRGRGEG